mmetsp:Transcript_11495/g.13117  ORF Transcript_11495/g.13117 Transcript_11495/m.13117 type:complete len:106 (-) Transcript_11495:1-318(-)
MVIMRAKQIILGIIETPKQNLSSLKNAIALDDKLPSINSRNICTFSLQNSFAEDGIGEFGSKDNLARQDALAPINPLTRAYCFMNVISHRKDSYDMGYRDVVFLL